MKSFYIGIKGIILQNSKILLLKRQKNNNYYWDAPGGRIDEGEEIKDALLRELKEEIGSNNVLIGNLLAVDKVTNLVEDDHDLLLVFYLIRGKIGKIKLSSEHIDYTWVSKEEMEIFLEKEKAHLRAGTIEAVRNAFSFN